MMEPGTRIVADEMREHGFCALTLGVIAARAGPSQISGVHGSLGIPADVARVKAASRLRKGARADVRRSLTSCGRRYAPSPVMDETDGA